MAVSDGVVVGFVCGRPAKRDIWALFVREERTEPVLGNARPRFDLATCAALGRPFWRVTLLGACLTFARFSEAFVILRASQTGLGLAMAPFVLVVMNVVFSLAAWPVGQLSDRIGRRGLLVCGVAVLCLADLALAFGGNLWMVMLGAGLWGLHLGLTQGLLSAEVAATLPAPLRATGFGLFGLTTGAATLIGNLLAGALWATAGPATTFGAGLLAGLICLAVLVRRSAT